MLITVLNSVLSIELNRLKLIFRIRVIDQAFVVSLCVPFPITLGEETSKLCLMLVADLEEN